MATHSSVLAWRIPGMGEPGGLPSMGLHRVGDGWSEAATAWYLLYLFYSYFFTRLRKLPFIPRWLKVIVVAVLIRNWCRIIYTVIVFPFNVSANYTESFMWNESCISEIDPTWSYPFHILGFPGGSAGKETACSAGDLGLIPGFGRFPGEGNGYPLQYSGLENSMDWISMGSQKVGHNWATLTSHIEQTVFFQRWPQQYNLIPHAFTTWPWHLSLWVVGSMILFLESGWDLCNFFNQDSTMGVAIRVFQD